MNWFRTLRIDGPANEARRRIASLCAFEGVRVTAGPANAFERTYALAEGPESTDPALLAAEVRARCFDKAIIALAIEPQPSDALPHLREVTVGPGAPAGVLCADIAGNALLIELSPETSPALLFSLIDLELRRWNGTRRTQLLAPLPDNVLAAIAADGLQCPEIAPDRILETLLGAARVD